MGTSTRGLTGFDLVVALLNAPITLITAVVNKATGATVRFERHFTVVCEGGWLSERGLSTAYTTGNTINIKAGHAEKLRNSDALLEHEWRHSVQWAGLGPVAFLALYVPSYFVSQKIAGCQCWNVFEWSAGFDDGGYPCRAFGHRSNEG